MRSWLSNTTSLYISAVTSSFKSQRPFLPHLWIFPVQIRLFFVERVQIIFIGSRDRLPDTSSKIGPPVARQLSVLFLRNIKILSAFTVRVLHGFLKPDMLIRTVVDDQIHNNVHSAHFCLCQQPIHGLHIAEQRIDIIIIGNIISLIDKRGLIHRGNPDDIQPRSFK